MDLSNIYFWSKQRLYLLASRPQTLAVKIGATWVLLGWWIVHTCSSLELGKWNGPGPLNPAWPLHKYTTAIKPLHYWYLQPSFLALLQSLHVSNMYTLPNQLINKLIKLVVLCCTALDDPSWPADIKQFKHLHKHLILH